MTPTWSEEFVGGSPEAERRTFAALAREIMKLQLTSRKEASAGGVPHGVDRAFHARSTFAAQDAELRFLELPPELTAGFARSGATYPVTVRFSNAAGTGRPDIEPDLRGVALRVTVAPDGPSHDLLMTNFPASHARDARQFVAFATATAGSGARRALGIARLALVCGPAETVRMLRNVLTARRKRVSSVAAETYWSRGAVRWGDTLAVRYLLRPAPGTWPGPEPAAGVPDYLSREMAERLAAGDVRFELCVQRYVDPVATPIEDCSVPWEESVSPAEPVAVLTIGRRDDRDDPEALLRARAVDAMAFNPWNTTDEFRPLGNLNRARRDVYDASVAHRRGERWPSTPPLRNVVVGAGARALFTRLNRRVEWYRLPLPLALLNLATLRQVLQRYNLIDTEPAEGAPRARPVPADPPASDRLARSFDGTDNDLSERRMGSAGATFGRNLQADVRPELFDEPNPITVSRELLTRDEFVPARTLNILAAGWIQFQVHDWVNHARRKLGEDDVRVPLPPGVPGWVNVAGGDPEPEMRIAGDVAANGAAQPVFANVCTHWWDGSEVYGTDPVAAGRLREGPKLRLTAEGYLPEDLRGNEITGFNESWWLGLSAMHTLFAREHNAVCDELRAHYPAWDDDRVYQTARLVVSALIAKIHTVEWTPTILGTEAIDVALHANWSGPPQNDRLARLGLWLVDEHATHGIPATKPDHFGVPFSLTEDFVAVYRLHPLLPDEFCFVDQDSGAVLGHRSFGEIQGPDTDEVLRETGLRNTLYSLGIAHPGAITLNNYPRSLQDFVRGDEHIDVSVVDLVRSRRRGVPRYNDFRAGLHRSRIRRWEDFPADPATIEKLRRVYRSVDEVDTMIGLFAETAPPGFGFSDTAFRIFILMASRRLQSDRFLTVDLRPEVYSPVGMDWVADNGMTEIILRHCPELASVLPREGTAFAPWSAPGLERPTGSGAASAPRATTEGTR